MPGGKKVSKELLLDPAARIKQLSEHGSSVEVKKTIPIKRYYRSGSEMERQARVYYSEGQLYKAFILYNKFATLFVEKLPKHPEYGKASPPDKARIKKLLKEAFPRAMELKEKLKKLFEEEKEEYERQLAEEETMRRAEEQRRMAEEKRKQEEQERQRAEEVAAFLAGEGGVTTDSVRHGDMKEPAPASGGMEPGQNVEPEPIGMVSNIVYESAMEPKQEVSQDAQQQPFQDTQTHWTSETTGTTTTTLDAQYHETTPTVPPPKYQDLQPTDTDDLTATDPNLAQVLPPTYQAPPEHQYQATPSQLPPGLPSLTHQQQQNMQQQGGTAVVTTPTSQLPHPVRTYDSIFASPYQQPPPAAVIPPVYGGGVPPYGGGYYQQPPAPVYGSHPQYMQHYAGEWGYQAAPTGYQQPTGPAPSAPEEEPEEDESNVPMVDRSTKPAYNALSTSIGGGYRAVYIPSDTARTFQDIASSNTRRNAETCGILAGKLSRNILRVTFIIVPKQKGGPDSCETLNEEELFDVQDQYDLITLGWIHTHPSQTAFMSSVDLHTHCSYQIMMDEAVAIVCAPRYNQVGVYMLTEPHGLDYITHCEELGFHTHPKEPPLYEECKHVRFDSEAFISVVDLR